MTHDAPSFRPYLRPRTRRVDAMSDFHAMTVRLPEQLAEELRVAADIAGRSMTAEVIIAIRNHLASVRRTPAFQDGLQVKRRRNEELLRRLSL